MRFGVLFTQQRVKNVIFWQSFLFFLVVFSDQPLPQLDLPGLMVHLKFSLLSFQAVPVNKTGFLIQLQYVKLAKPIAALLYNVSMSNRVL